MTTSLANITANQVETHILKGTLVLFGLGAEVLHIKHPADYSAIRFSDNRARCTAQEIAVYMFKSFKEAVGPTRIFVLTDPDVCPSVAHVQVRDPAFAARIKVRFDRYAQMTPKANMAVRPVPVEIGYEMSRDQPDIPGLELFLLEDRLAAIKIKENPASPECAVCLADADDEPYRTPCGHRYCRACFLAQCSSVTKPHEFPIRCFGDSGRCSRIFLLPELRLILQPDLFEQLLSRSFNIYSRTLTTIRTCPTPDCDHTYRTTTNGTVITCLRCSTPICTTCHAPSHYGLTCATYQKIGTKEYESWLCENKNIKRCPKCRNLIEKVGGCQVVECKCCWARFCWFCMEILDGQLRCRCVVTVSRRKG